MNSFSRLLQTSPKKYPPRIKVILFCTMMFSISLFPIWLAIANYIRGSENLQDLTHIQGRLKESRIMKHKHVSKYRIFYEDVLVLRIDSCDDEFGFMEYNEIYPRLSGIVERNEPPYFEIYYDKYRKRIEQNVTLHTFDMKINGRQYVSIDEIKKSEFLGTKICSAIVLLLLIITYWGSRKIIQKGVIA